MTLSEIFLTGTIGLVAVAIWQIFNGNCWTSALLLTGAILCASGAVLITRGTNAKRSECDCPSVQ